jgi:glycosyltransferase involved in cell wall biosynthesis
VLRHGSAAAVAVAVTLPDSGALLVRSSAWCTPGGTGRAAAARGAPRTRRRRRRTSCDSEVPDVLPENSGPVLPVTVVIPAHDRADVIQRAISSARHQLPRPPAEVIVVDDCSSDDTPARAEAAGALVIRHDRNQGPGGARNTAARAATQPWLAFLDSDDVWLSGHLDTALRHAAGHVLVSAPGVEVHADGRPSRLVGNGHGTAVELTSPLAVMSPENLVATSGTVVSTDAFHRAGGFPAGHRSEDLDLWIRVLEQGRGTALPDPGYVYAPAEVHMSSDTSGMRTAAMSYLAAYQDREWFDPRVLRRLAAQDRWDDLRAALAAGRRRPALRHGAWIATHPAAPAAVVRLLAYRRATRAAGTRAAQSIPAEVRQALGLT